MGAVEEFLSAILGDVLGESGPAAEFGVSFDHHKAFNAHALLLSVAQEVSDLEPWRNSVGFFPRVMISEHSDRVILLHAMEAYAEQQHDKLLSAVRGFALGSSEYEWAEIQALAGEYVEGARLAKALMTEHRDKHEQAKQDAEANRRAGEAFSEISYANLVTMAKQSGAVMSAIHEDKKILAIKELRMEAQCSLRDAKLAVEGVQAELRSDAQAAEDNDSRY